jgi:hypothetical protein
MLMCNSTSVIREKSKMIPIKNNLSTYSPKSDYSIKQNLFDPSKSSPPNDFMKKLEKRIKIYNNFYVDSKDDSLDNE